MNLHVTGRYRRGAARIARWCFEWFGQSFFALLQHNVLNRQRWRTSEDLRLAIVSWIERTYHRRRRQRALGNLTPIEFEALHEVVHAA